jgi:hypothetical protein
LHQISAFEKVLPGPPDHGTVISNLLTDPTILRRYAPFLQSPELSTFVALLGMYPGGQVFHPGGMVGFYPTLVRL